MIAALCVVGVVGQAIAAANPHLVKTPEGHTAKARAHVDALELDLAQGELDLALRAGNSGRAEVAEIYRLLGVVAAGLDQPGAAQEHFRHLLALEPSAAAPDAYGPKIVQPFADARASMVGRPPLGAAIAPALVGAIELVVVVTDPVGLVAGVRARVEDGAEVAKSGTRVTLDAPPMARRVSVVLVDTFGNRLLAEDLPVHRDVPPPGPPPARDSPSVFARWPLWAITSGVFVAAGVGLALAAKSARDDLDALRSGPMPPSYSEVHDLDAKGRRYTLGANLAFGAGAATGIVSAILFFRGSSSPSVTVAPTDGGAALGWQTHF